jgi:hypothetical protein
MARSFQRHGDEISAEPSRWQRVLEKPPLVITWAQSISMAIALLLHHFSLVLSAFAMLLKPYTIKITISVHIIAQPSAASFSCG